MFTYCLLNRNNDNFALHLFCRRIFPSLSQNFVSDKRTRNSLYGPTSIQPESIIRFNVAVPIVSQKVNLSTVSRYIHRHSCLERAVSLLTAVVTLHVCFIKNHFVRLQFLDLQFPQICGIHVESLSTGFFSPVHFFR